MHRIFNDINKLSIDNDNNGRLAQEKQTISVDEWQTQQQFDEQIQRSNKKMIVPIIFSGSIASLQLILVGALLTSAAANYISHKGLMNGLAFPSEIDAVVGEQIYLQIIEPVTQQTGCHYRMTGGKDVDVKTPHKPK